jgi:hypothetical protein
MLIRTVLICLGFSLPLIGALEAASAERRKAARQARLEQPPKDCTRYNSRYGFYGNIWCTPAEQDRFDRWDAARLRTK